MITSAAVSATAGGFSGSARRRSPRAVRTSITDRGDRSRRQCRRGRRRPRSARPPNRRALRHTADTRARQGRSATAQAPSRDRAYSPGSLGSLAARALDPARPSQRARPRRWRGSARPQGARATLALTGLRREVFPVFWTPISAASWLMSLYPSSYSVGVKYPSVEWRRFVLKYSLIQSSVSLLRSAIVGHGRVWISSFLEVAKVDSDTALS